MPHCSLGKCCALYSLVVGAHGKSTMVVPYAWWYICAGLWAPSVVLRGHQVGVICSWQLLVNLYGEQVGFLVDSGAQTSLLGQDCYRQLCDKGINLPLHEMDIGLDHTGGEHLQVYGKSPSS